MKSGVSIGVLLFLIACVVSMAIGYYVVAPMLLSYSISSIQ